MARRLTYVTLHMLLVPGSYVCSTVLLFPMRLQGGEEACMHNSKLLGDVH